MQIDIRITGDLSKERAIKLQAAVAKLTLPEVEGTEGPPPSFLGVEGLYVSREEGKIGDIFLYFSMDIKERPEKP